MKIQNLLLLLLCTIQCCQGEPYGGDYDGMTTYSIPPPQNIANSIDSGMAKSYRFAKSIPTSISFQKSDFIVHTKDTWRWIIKIQSQNALSLSLIFDRWVIPKKSQIYIYNKQGDVLDMFPTKRKKFATTPLQGDAIYVEYVSPYDIVEIPVIHIYRVVYGYRPLFEQGESSGVSNRYQHSFRKQTHHSGKCNVDLTCDMAGSEWLNEARSVAVLLTDENQMYCTGVLLNNAAHDGRQLLLTAYHCIGSKNHSDTDIVMFNYQKKSCNKKRITPSKDVLHGLTFLVGSPLSDFALFEIQEPIPKKFNVYLAGWSTISQPKSPLVGIHHPSGDFKKLSIYNGKLTATCWDECPETEHWRIERWTRGTTEPGSSGSPLFDQDHFVVGQLHGGSASCWNKNGYDIYGSFNASWNLGLSFYLDPYQKLNDNSSTFTIHGEYFNKLMSP